jgi:hypothetical protein
MTNNTPIPRAELEAVIAELETQCRLDGYAEQLYTDDPETRAMFFGRKDALRYSIIRLQVLLEKEAQS